MFVVPLVLALAGCTAPTAPSADGDDSGAEPTGLDATLLPNASIGTVATVTFEAAASAAWVEVQEEGGPIRRFPATADETGTAWSARLVGLAAATDYTWRAVATVDGADIASTDAVFETEPPPLWLPALTTVVPAQDEWTPAFALTTFIGEAHGAAIFDQQGRYVWWWESAEDTMPCQARVGLDGNSLTFLVVDQKFTDDVGTLVRMELDGSIRWQQRAVLAHHDFVELPDGRIAFLTFDLRMVNGVQTIGDGLAVLDPETGTDEKLWSVWDHFPNPLPGGESLYSFGWDWTHGNGLAYDVATGDYLVSLHNIDTLVRVAADGEQRWVMGGPESDFTLTGGRAFAQQHSPVFTDEGILLFDNGSPNPEDLYSRAVAYRVDEEARTFEETWQHDGDKALYSAYMGSVAREADGSALIGWGSGGRVSRVDPDGTVVWQVESAVGSSFGFTHPIATLGETLE